MTFIILFQTECAKTQRWKTKYMQLSKYGNIGQHKVSVYIQMLRAGCKRVHVFANKYWSECSLCLVLEGLQTAGLGSWQSFVSGQRGVKTVLPGTVYQSCAAQPNPLHQGLCVYGPFTLTAWPLFVQQCSCLGVGRVSALVAAAVPTLTSVKPDSPGPSGP